MRSHAPSRPVARLLLALLAGTVALLVVSPLNAAPAHAHAELLDMMPGDGETLAEPPEDITLVFSEAVRAGDGAVRLIDPAGAEQVLEAHSVDTRVEAEVPADLAPGGYLVAWEVVSADGHPISGAWGFVITDSSGSPSESDSTTTAAPEPDEVSVPEASAEPVLASDLPRASMQAAQYVGLLATLGIAVTAAFLVPPDHARRLRRRLARACAMTLTLGVIASVALIPATGITRSAPGASVLDPQTWIEGAHSGQGLSSATAVLGLTLTGSGLRARNRAPIDSRRTSVPRAVIMGGLGLLLLAPVLVGHTRTVDPAWLVVASDVVHVLAGGVWLGGLIALAIVLGTSASPVAERALVVARFSAVAASTVALLGVSGVLLGWRILGSWSAFVQTAYGLTLIVKLGLVAVALMIAGYNRFRLLPRVRAGAGQATLRRVVATEAVVVVLAALVTGSLVGQDPTTENPPQGATGPAATAPDEGSSGALDRDVELGADGADGRVRFSVDPDVDGLRAVRVDLTAPDGSPLLPVSDPVLTASHPASGVGPLAVALTPTGQGDGRYEGTLDLPLSGDWVLEMRVRTSTFDEPAARVYLQVP